MSERALHHDDEILRIMSDPRFGQLAALEKHLDALQARTSRTARLADTVRKTIDVLRGDSKMLSDRELYDGLSPDPAGGQVNTTDTSDGS